MSIDLLKQALIRDKKLVITVRIRPNASVSKVTGFLIDGSIKISLSAPAVDNKANLALVKFLAGEFGVEVKNVTIISGATARIKLVRIG